MGTREIFEIDAKNFDDFEGFIREFNDQYVSKVGGDWSGNLDAFNDYLGWHVDPYVLRWRNSWKSRMDLGYGAMVIWYLKRIIDSESPCDDPDWQNVDAARKRQGPTIFDWLVETISEHAPHVLLELDDRGSRD